MTTPNQETTATPAAPQYRILVVEDDESIARLVMTSLSSLGLECHWAADGEGALEAFDELQPHLILLDLILPGMDGRDVCARIREVSTVPIIMLTALDEEEVQLKSFKLGADDYVPKPFNPKLLIARVVANLRRVYRYDAERAPVALSADMTGTNGGTTVIPPNWATCDACGYMGPRPRFEKENWRGETYAVCPNCGQTEHIIFSID